GDREIESIYGQIIHIRYNMFKSAEDEGGDKKPHIKNLGKRSLFLPDSSDENRKRYKQAAEDTKKNQDDRSISDLRCYDFFHTLKNSSLKSCKMNEYGNNQCTDPVSDPGNRHIAEPVRTIIGRKRADPCK